MAGKMPAATIDTANWTSDKSHRNFRDEEHGNEAETTDVSCGDWRGLFPLPRFAVHGPRRLSTRE
jgi:hypothetical protein